MKKRSKNKLRLVYLSDMLVMMKNVEKASTSPDVGFLDTMLTIEEFFKQLDRPVTVSTEALEKCLWSCNLLDEEKKFYHPKKMSFTRFLRKVLKGDHFDKTLNLIEEKKPGKYN